MVDFFMVNAQDNLRAISEIVIEDKFKTREN